VAKNRITLAEQERCGYGRCTRLDTFLDTYGK